MKREYVMVSVVSAVIGAALMLLTIGGSRSAGIEGWVPVNGEMMAALDSKGMKDEGLASAEGTASVKSAEAKNTEAETTAVNTAETENTAAMTEAEAAPGSEAGSGERTAEMASGTVNPDAASSNGSGAAAFAQPSSVPSEQDGLISINTADYVQLQKIPGIGEKKAQAIVDYRNKQGSFISLSDLKKVKGIGDKVFQKMKPYIKL
ncbi:ComEA family DNA-binding protein [Paenibacillus fonticola]|uniref:ComEA family DNA-binding protein n=1 Tax=Paenibacillus fonticola TaxID=379896 RepID=UPI000381CB1B|nr:helix-hairpin-helix domain-containing protein [Paenibacillus fonticola]